MQKKTEETTVHNCIYEEVEEVDYDIFGHSTYRVFCVRTGERKDTTHLWCEKFCKLKSVLE